MAKSVASTSRWPVAVHTGSLTKPESWGTGVTDVTGGVTMVDAASSWRSMPRSAAMRLSARLSASALTVLSPLDPTSASMAASRTTLTQSLISTSSWISASIAAPTIS